MKNLIRIGTLSLVLGLGMVCPVLAAAEATAKAPEISLALEPSRYVAINGDAAQFRAHHWMSTSYSGGIKEFALEDELADGIQLSAEGHAIPSDGDYAGEFKLVKEGFGYLLFEYKQFRKYYGSSGGVFNPFLDLASIDTDKDLHLDIGEFSAEAGLRMENLPDITLNYTREFKQGTKSRLTWTSVVEGPTTAGVTPTANVTRKIGPSWQEIDEVVDKFKVEAEDDTIYGFHWHSSQDWEYVRSHNKREEQSYANDPIPASGSSTDLKVRDQYTEPRSNLITTVLGLNKWFAKDKVYVSSDYRFSQLSSRELENIKEFDQRGIPTNFSNAEQVVNAYSDNLYTSHTYVGSVSSFLLNQLSLMTRFKVESIGKRGESTYPKDNSPSNANGSSKPDGVIDQSDVSNTSDKINTFGEGVALRFTAIPRVTIYNEYEFQQTRDNLYEDRQSKSAGEVFNRQDIAHLYRGSGVLGFNFIPWDSVVLTTDVRHREDAIHYNNVRYTDNSASGAKSVFITAQDIETNELSTKVRLKPCHWFQPSFRYQLQDKDYDTWGLSDVDNDQESGMTSHIYTVDVTIQPTDELLTTTSLSVQRARVFTPAGLNDYTNAQTPTYNADVLSALFSAEYALNKDLVVTGLTQWSDAGDFNNLGGNISYGADYTEFDVTIGLRWTPKADMVIEPKYSFYRYDPSPDLDMGGYNASVISLDVKFTWG